MMNPRFQNRRRRALAQLTPTQLQSLAQANRLIAAGKPDEAAPILGQLAKEMEDSNHPRRAANLHAVAAHAYADSKNETQALAQARAALNLFIQYSMVERIPRFYTNITQKMTRRGMNSAAITLQNEFGSKVSSIPAIPPSPAAPAPAPRRGRLPTNCSQCGAGIRSDEINWIDDHTAECNYCGSLIQTID